MVQPRGPERPHRRHFAAPRGRRDDVRGRDRDGPARGPRLDDHALEPGENRAGISAPAVRRLSRVGTTRSSTDRQIYPGVTSNRNYCGTGEHALRKSKATARRLRLMFRPDAGFVSDEVLRWLS